MKLDGKAALVTGGTKGIGAATAIELARRGADLVINGRNEDEEARGVRAKILALGRRCEIVTADVAKPDEATRCVKETAELLGSCDVLVHSAGGPVPGSLLDVAPEAWYGGFDVHVHAAFHLCRAAVPLMRQKGEGAIVLVSSVAGIRGCPGIIAYGTVKGAVLQFARMLARELADDNIRVNCVSPGIIRTRFHDKMTPGQKQHNLDNRIPLHREGKPDDIAQAVALLVENDYATGENVVIDGGLTMRIA